MRNAGPTIMPDHAEPMMAERAHHALYSLIGMEGPVHFSAEWFDDVTAAIGLAAIGGLVFFWRVFNTRLPIVDLRAFGDRNFAAGSVFSFVMGIGLYGLTYLYPLYLARVRGSEAARLLVAAAHPVIVAGRCARTPDGVRLLVELAYSLAA